ncbi:NUDIX domain-containing protein [Paracoccus sp. TK19116]|uniref:ADP-ribose pyrophosphatase n=1 Tax=Paracoccus albicereus TaxID=2922394 RepID=A0ABT1MN64_9RHOB|nr:NUDIX domain-containing protein [Paracoccus albicereus]MCQ0969728.1 NUDIX domain-containing protein [Paracoccus albicereus]
MSEVLLVGPPAHPALAEALGVVGRPETIPATLTGGLQAGIQRHNWPVLHHDDGAMTEAVRAPMTPTLNRYASVMGLTPIDWRGDRILGALAHGPGGVAWDRHRWRAPLAAGIAGAIAALPADRDIAAIAARLPQIAVWADSRLRASRETRPLMPAPRDDDAWHLSQGSQPYADFFAVEEWTVSHLRHDGGQSPQMRRAAMILGDAAVVLPWDPVRDRVLVIEQFRVVPALRDDPQPWLIEPIAGRIDAGETPEIAARREAMEEAGLRLGSLIPAMGIYPSPGALAEYLYLFVAPVDLPDDVIGIHGLASEAEDIRSHLLDRSELTRMALAGEVPNGPLATLALWLEVRAAELRAQA